MDIENSAGCLLVDGCCALRLKVDHDLLRGSGRPINEPFGVHVGAQPGQKGRVLGPNGEIRIGWDMEPSIGSLRRQAYSLGLAEGDYLFIRRTSPTTVDFLGVDMSTVSMRLPAERIHLLIGRSPIDADEWRVGFAESLGIGRGSAAAELEVGALQRRLWEAELHCGCWHEW